MQTGLLPTNSEELLTWKGSGQQLEHLPCPSGEDEVTIEVTGHRYRLHMSFRECLTLAAYHACVE